MVSISFLRLVDTWIPPCFIQASLLSILDPGLQTISEFPLQPGKDADAFFHHCRADLDRLDPAPQNGERLGTTGNATHADDVESASGGVEDRLRL